MRLEPKELLERPVVPGSRLGVVRRAPCRESVERACVRAFLAWENSRSRADKQTSRESEGELSWKLRPSKESDGLPLLLSVQ